MPAPRTTRASTKRAAPDANADADYAAAKKPTAKKPKTTAPVITAAPLAAAPVAAAPVGVLSLHSRRARPIRPEAAEEPPPRRSSTQVALANAEEDIRRLNEKYTRDVAVAATASLRMQQDVVAAQGRDAAVMTIADLIPELPQDEMDLDRERFYAGEARNSEMEYFMHYPAQPERPFSSEDEDDSEFPQASTLAAGIAKRKGKGKAAEKVPRAAIESQYQQQQKKIQVQSKPKKRFQNSNAVASSSRAGLIAKFRAPYTDGGTFELTSSDSESPTGNGGLRDVDVFSARPDYLKKTARTAVNKKDVYAAMTSAPARSSNSSRKNQFVSIDSSDEDAPCKSVKVEKKMTALSFGLRKTLPPAAKSKARITVSLLAAPAFVPPAVVAVPINGLPAFVAHRWSGWVMPLLHRALNKSTQPRSLGYNNEETLTVFKRVIDKACPGNTYVPVWGDAIVSRGSARLGERRSAIGTSGGDMLVSFFIDPKKFPTVESIKGWVRYALDRRGPALFKDPTPRKDLKITDRDDPRYVKARGLFESGFVIALLAPLLKVGGSGFPYGGVGLVAASIERNLIRYRSGIYDETNSNFTKDLAGTAVDGYLASALDLSERAQARILAACNALAAPVVEVLSSPARMSLDGVREGLYEASSP
ncbi:hypothetical protein C8F04DRAFT_1184061 [Mycena alexandri]|uniref:Uncharacterized protein n=1 Tax=Mycena alexandri TaxID=1745969 RepID=A0AAD6X1Y1_9AGAR|nr:hypothetical protein C8F04DRAFT_1184061 [Mycena alexandri]